MIEFNLTHTIDLREFASLDTIIRGLRSELAQAVQETSTALMSAWAKEATIAIPKARTYNEHITSKQIDQLHVIVENDHPAVVFLEQGINPFDMKRMLSSSARVRVSKDGKRYLVIPFHHKNTEMAGSGLDAEEYEGLGGSSFKRNNPPPHEYKWGEHTTDLGDVGKRRKFFTPITGQHARFDKSGADRSTPFGPFVGTIDYTWKTSPFESVYRFEDNRGKTQSYTSFRTMSESESQEQAWYHPGIRAMRIAENAVEEVRPEFLNTISSILREAVTSSRKV